MCCAPASLAVQLAAIDLADPAVAAYRDGIVAFLRGYHDGVDARLAAAAPGPRHPILDGDPGSPNFHLNYYDESGR